MFHPRGCGLIGNAESALLRRGRPFPLFLITHTTPVRSFGTLIREVDSRGFQADFCALRHKNAASTQRIVAESLKHKQNVLFCGAHHTGKMTILRALGEASERRRRRVAYVSADAQRACRFGGLLLYHFLGMRYMGGREELPSRDQLEGALERHVRLCEATYAACLPNLLTADVLILDGVERIEPTIILSMDAVCRRLRDRKREAFGGLRVFAAADFWQLPVHPCSDTGGYIHQLDTWHELFPQQRLLERIHGQDRRLTELVNRAYYGLLRAEDVEELQSGGARAKSSVRHKGRTNAKAKASTEAEENAAGSGEAEAQGEEEDAMPSLGESGGVSMPPQHVISNVDAVIRFTPRFPKQAAIRVPPPRFRTLKRTEIGNFVVNTLAQSSMAQSFGLVDALNVEVGSSVHLLHDAPAPINIAAGTIGEVLQVRDHILVVHFPSLHRTVDVPRMRISVYHSFYPEVRYEIQQFPLFPRHSISPAKLISYPHAFNVHIDCHRLADTNDLGNILARMRSFDDFTIEHVQDYVRVDGMVHEPTRIYYQRIANRPLSPAAEQWCRNCKTYIPTADFYEHWDQCIRQVRWCSECNTRIPLERLEPHREKHQIVLCMDCGRAVEWRQWEGHRLTCAAMMREVSPENDFLPLRTRQLALEMGLDRRDLHTMRAFSRNLLPKSRKQWNGKSET